MKSVVAARPAVEMDIGGENESYYPERPAY